MEVNSTLLVSVSLLVFAVGFAVYTNSFTKGTFNDKNLLKRGLNTPTVWIYVDDSDVNSRWWADFGARSSRVYNLPFLNLCYQSIVNATKDNFHVEVISGLGDAERRLGSLPAPLRNKKLPLRTEETTYLKVAFLEKFGGLWLNPATICIEQFPALPKDRVVFFGSDPRETYAGKDGTFIPNQHAMWSPYPNHPVFVKWRQMLEGRIERQAGGKEVRGDNHWDLLYSSTNQSDIYVMPNAELTRKSNGRKIELDDLLASGTEGELPFTIPAKTLYVPIPYPEVLERRTFGWFLRMSEEQILTSDIGVSHLFRKATLI